MSQSLAVRPAPEPQTIDGYPGTTEDLLSKLVHYFEDSEWNTTESRLEAERARDFVSGIHWTADEIRILKERRQPITWNNIIARKIALLNGLERRGRSDPKAFPRTPTEDNRADAATQALRYVADQNRYDVIRSSVFENMMVEGAGGCEVIVELDEAGSGYDVVINHIPWERLFWDPHSRHPGFSDASYLGVVIWMDRDDALDKYPGCEDILSSTFDTTHSQTFDDRPHQMWADRRRRRVRVVQIHWKVKQKDWWTATLTKGGFLEGPMKSPYLDRHGNATCPLIMRGALIDRDNNRFGMVRDMIPLQESINKRETKLLHSLSVNQVIMENGAVDDVDHTRREVAKPDGVIVTNHGLTFEIRKDEAEIKGHFEMLQYAITQMNSTGPNANMAGKDPRDQSGRAIIAQQAGGQVENEPMADALRQFTHKVYEASWMRIRQFWTAEKWIRVTDNDKNVKFVGLNHPLTIMDLINNLDRTQPLPMQIQALPATDQRALQLGMQLQPGDPRLQTVVRIENDVSDMDVDITVEEGPDVPTLQAEQFQTLMQLPPQLLLQFPPSLIIQASSLRNKDELLKMLEDHQKSQMQAQQEAQQIAKAGATAKVDKDAAAAADTRAQTLERMHGIAKDHADHPMDQVERLHGMAMDHAGSMAPDQPPEQPPQPEGPDPMAVAAQQHSQGIDAARLALDADQQRHAQRMDLMGIALQARQAKQAAQRPQART